MGKVKLGATHASLREQGLVGVLRPGCELGGDSTRAARLKAPLSGSVDYSLTNPRKVRAITIRGGAKAKGVGIGATIPQIKAKFPHAKVDHSLEDIGLFTIVRIPKRDGGRFMFGVDPDTKKTESHRRPEHPDLRIARYSPAIDASRESTLPHRSRNRPSRRGSVRTKVPFRARTSIVATVRKSSDPNGAFWISTRLTSPAAGGRTWPQNRRRVAPRRRTQTPSR